MVNNENFLKCCFHVNNIGKVYGNQSSSFFIYKLFHGNINYLIIKYLFFGILLENVLH